MEISGLLTKVYKSNTATSIGILVLVDLAIGQTPST